MESIMHLKKGRTPEEWRVTQFAGSSASSQAFWRDVRNRANSSTAGVMSARGGWRGMLPYYHISPSTICRSCANVQCTDRNHSVSVCVACIV